MMRLAAEMTSEMEAMAAVDGEMDGMFMVTGQSRQGRDDAGNS
jgi:hypothetical protein